ncbi:MAG: ABC transporter permease [Lachnospiraceae bacterium]|nr:ABC transporter permease [Lachnospiraceae bacterium]
MSIVNYLLSAFSIGIIFLLGATGEIITEKVGHLNLGIPGVMSVGATGGCIALQAMYKYRDVLPGWLIVLVALLACFICAGLMGLLYCFITVSLHSNQNVTGLALTTFGVGITKYEMSKLTRIGAHEYLYALPIFRQPFSDSTNALKYCGVMTFIALFIAIAVSFVLYRTKVGLNLRAVGESAATADAVGINVTAYKYVATIIGSGIAGFGGLYYIMDYAGSQEAYLSIEALGWLSVALVIFSLWKPLVCVFGSFVFGLLYIANAYAASILGITLPMKLTPIMKLLPYVATVIILVLTSIRKRRENQPPAGLGITYFREER